MLNLDIINWENVNAQSSNFKNSSPTKWAFVKDFVNKDLYEELYETYPKWDDAWQKQEGHVIEGAKLSYRKFWKRDEGRFYTDGTFR